MSNDFAYLLQKHRKSAEMSVYRLAQVSKTPSGTLALVEKGKRSPPQDSVKLWAKTLKISGDDLAQFTRAAQRARAYSQVDARPELDALNAEVEAAKSVFKAMVPLLAVSDAVKSEINGAFDKVSVLSSLLAIKNLLKGI